MKNVIVDQSYNFAIRIVNAYKECLETKCWLKLLHDIKFIEQHSFRSMLKEADETAKILFSILKKTRIDK